MTNAKNRSSKDKRILIASLLVAATILAGSTFAWFTSKDEVTNRLTAAADYGVSIVEDFTPPEDWLPGQEINKDVSIVNTGNIDAYVRVAIL
ncbi:MAG: BsaA family SipW-dependent biofilm matrix protein, partial [Ruminococcus sp.]|nr:BsaA family SipW-dependent biofilm matrix protein [Ruminococcus sp.]